jgi:hypothetical protein
MTRFWAEGSFSFASGRHDPLQSTKRLQPGQQMILTAYFYRSKIPLVRVLTSSRCELTSCSLWVFPYSRPFWEKRNRSERLCERVDEQATFRPSASMPGTSGPNQATAPERETLKARLGERG